MSNGIYKITNKENQNVIIGYSKNIEKRKEWHKNDLIADRHKQFNLQKEFNERVYLEIKNNEDNKYKKYIDYKSYIFDSVYEVKLIKALTKDELENEDFVRDLTDEYILKEREKQKGYEQLSYKEIKQIKIESDKYEQFQKDKEDGKIDLPTLRENIIKVISIYLHDINNNVLDVFQQKELIERLKEHCPYKATLYRILKDNDIKLDYMNNPYDYRLSKIKIIDEDVTYKKFINEDNKQIVREELKQFIEKYGNRITNDNGREFMDIFKSKGMSIPDCDVSINMDKETHITTFKLY